MVFLPAERHFQDELGRSVSIRRRLYSNRIAGVTQHWWSVDADYFDWVLMKDRKQVAKLILRWRRQGQITGLSAMDLLTGT